MRVHALVLAAGSGSRHGPAPKQYLDLLGQPVLRHAVARFLAHPRVNAVRVVIGAHDGLSCAAALAGLALPPPVIGGPTRQASALAGLEALAADAPDIVLIHDAARPLVPATVIDAVLDAIAAGADGALPGLAVSDTLKRAAAGCVVATVPRHDVVRVQTPQAFVFGQILRAHRAATAEHSDDAGLIEASGGRVAIVPGDENLMKVTMPGDIARLQALMGGFETRIGTGFDVHRLVARRRLVLCGIEIPHDQGLDGHSDADVGIHALCDALYGALAEGDIGRHFPPSQARWKNADSALFLQHAAGLVAARGGRIVNADVTLVCEAPRIGPYAPAMQARLAALMAIAPARVGVKATTSERLGFTGRGEGIAAQAAVSVEVPVRAPD